MTGLGLATSDGTEDGDILPSGDVAPADANPLFQTVGRPTVLFGDDPSVEGEVIFSGLAPGFAGLYQINVFVPDDPPIGDAVVLTVRMPDGTEDQSLIAIVE